MEPRNQSKWMFGMNENNLDGYASKHKSFSNIGCVLFIIRSGPFRFDFKIIDTHSEVWINSTRAMTGTIEISEECDPMKRTFRRCGNWKPPKRFLTPCIVTNRLLLYINIVCLYRIQCDRSVKKEQPSNLISQTLDRRGWYLVIETRARFLPHIV